MKKEDAIIEKTFELKQKHSAFSYFIEKGIDSVKKYFPHQLEWVLKNKDKSFTEVQDLLEAESIAINQR